MFCAFHHLIIDVVSWRIMSETCDWRRRAGNRRRAERKVACTVQGSRLAQEMGIVTDVRLGRQA
ncbi:hypothetical protein ISX56_32005 [Serratia ureilytica]|nr:hypothetical protein [Serratia ureilytica]